MIFAALALSCLPCARTVEADIAGYKPEQIAPMFKGAPDNVTIPEGFKPWL